MKTGLRLVQDPAEILRTLTSVHFKHVGLQAMQKYRIHVHFPRNGACMHEEESRPGWRTHMTAKEGARNDIGRMHVHSEENIQTPHVNAVSC